MTFIITFRIIISRIYVWTNAKTVQVAIVGTQGRTFVTDFNSVTNGVIGYDYHEILASNVA